MQHASAHNQQAVNHIMAQKMNSIDNGVLPYTASGMGGMGGLGGAGIGSNPSSRNHRQTADVVIANRLLGNNLDTDGMSEILKQVNSHDSLDIYREHVKTYATLKNEIKALQMAIKTRREKFESISNILFTFMEDNDIEFLNTKYGFIAAKHMKVKRQLPKKQILEKAQTLLKDSEFEKLKMIMDEKIVTDVKKMEIVK